MDIQTILKNLEFNNGTFPREALQSAMAAREKIIPELLEIIKHVKDNAQVVLKQDNYMAHMYAFYLLAQFREVSAYPLIVDFFSLPGEISLEITGDLVTEDLDRILVSVCGGEIDLMKRLIEDDNINEYVRSAALNGLTILVARGIITREEIIEYFQSLFQGKLTREYSYVWTSLVTCCAKIYPEEVIDEIKKVYDEDLVDQFFIRIEDVYGVIANGEEKTIENLKLSNYCLIIENIIDEMGGWSCFEQSHNNIKKVKVGRNEPCPCGSGKKYKKCCIDKK